jgi:ADP-heptose:LPS heptosyltransferase
LQNFRKLLKLLRERYPNLGILLLGDQEQYQECESLKLDSQIINLASRTNLLELACLVSKAKMVISNDSAVLHIASAVGTPTLAIFGPTSELKYGPLAESSVVVRRHYPCSPCEKAQCVYEDLRCLKSITPEEVLEFASKIMKGEKIVLREEYSRILLTRVDKIGDLILTTPAIEAVRKNFPHSFICFLCDKRTQEIISSNPYLDEVLILDKSGQLKGMRNFFKLLNLIRKRKFDLVINFHPTKRVHLLCF